jgi:hypothetical protein
LPRRCGRCHDHGRRSRRSRLVPMCPSSACMACRRTRWPPIVPVMAAWPGRAQEADEQPLTGRRCADLPIGQYEQSIFSTNVPPLARHAPSADDLFFSAQIDLTSPWLRFRDHETGQHSMELFNPQPPLQTWELRGRPAAGPNRQSLTPRAQGSRSERG